MCGNFIKDLFGFGAEDQLLEQSRAAERERQRIHAEESAAAEQQRQEMLRREAERQTNIKSGNSAIDQAFSQFNPEYFGGVQKAFTGAHLPEIDDQYQKALAKLTASLAGRGMLESTAGFNQIGDLDKTAGNARAKVANDALDFTNKFRGSVDQSRNQLYDFSLSAADPSSVAARAQGEATTLAATNPVPSVNPGSIGDIFGAALQPLAYAATAAANAPRSTQNKKNTGFAPTTGAGSSKLIG